MAVERIDIVTLGKLLSGKLQHPITCIIKFYSNTCGYCHALEVPYREMADEFKDVLFFAINSEEVPDHLINHLGVDGVPSFIAIPRTRLGRTPRPRLLKDPQNPHPVNFYYVEDIRNFVRQNNPTFTRKSLQNQTRKILENE